MNSRPSPPTGPYNAYKNAAAHWEEDRELTHVGPGTPGGEYLRRFWQPIAFSKSVKDLPLRIRVLGEDLVLFRDKSLRIGLLALHCSHRGTSLEFGVIRDRGISCCYHGWHFDIDGRILQIPDQPPGSRLEDDLCHGAYPVHEYGELIFAFMGPPDKKPAFPILDNFNLPSFRTEPWGGFTLPCNWVQVKENSMDPVHTAHLHTISNSLGFTPSFAEKPQLEFQKLPSGMASVASRRVGDNVWVRVNNLIMPNIHQYAATWEDGKQTKAFTRPMQTHWAVPIDDTTTMNIGFNHHGENGSDRALLDTGADFGQAGDRPYEERQRVPGDFDAQTSIGPISIHAREYLSPTDNGVIMFRNMLRSAIRSLEEGHDPVPAPRNSADEIITYASDTILKVPKSADETADRQMMRDIGRRVLNAIPTRDLGGLALYRD